jgi:hypothetical protein
MHHLRIQPSEVESLPFYEYHYIVKELSTMLKEQEKGNSKQSEEMNEQMANIKSSQPKMPNMTMPKMPNFTAPKF